MKDINTLTVADLTENAPPFTGWRWATEEAISAWGQAMKHGDRSVLDLAKKVKRQLDMMVAAPAPRIADQSPHDRQAAYDYLNEKGVSHILVSHLVEFAKIQNSNQQQQPNAWRDPTNGDPAQSVTFEKGVAGKWPHIYSMPLYAKPTPECKACSNTGYIPEGNHCMACSEPADPNIEELFSRQQAGFERCFEALGITDDRERSWSSLVLAINGALEGRKQDFEFEGWFDKEYPQDDEGHRPKYNETSVMTLLRHAFEAGRDLTINTNRSAIVPLTGAPHERISELIRQRDDAKTRLLKMENDFNALTRLCKRAETAAAEAQVELKNLRTAKPLGKIPPEGDAEHWKNLYLQEMACRITWQQKALENMAELSRSFEQWWDDKRDELIQDTDPRRHAEAAWNASAANWARAGKEPVATLHDDGYYTFKRGKEPYGARYAGWKMEVYAAQPIEKSANTVRELKDKDILEGGAAWRFESTSATIYKFSPQSFITCVRKILEGKK
jgi:hypothetical protein